MILQQFYLECLAQASYLIADETSKVACVVDPRRDVAEYLDFARARGLRIEHTLLTHIHADFLAGHLELAAQGGARIHVGHRADTEFECLPIFDGQELVLGPECRLRFWETPGHTPESVCILVERSGEAAPYAVLTGDTLFAGEVGRPDLLVSAGIQADDLAGMLFDSLHGKLLTLPDETLVYPGHGAGSACGKNISQETVTTIGQQRQFNWALAPMAREDFITRLTSDLPQPPAYFVHDAVLNRKRRATLEEMLDQALRPLSLYEARALGCQLLDTRPPELFAAGHVAGSINIGLDGTFASWAGTVLDGSRPIALICEAGREHESALRLGRIGFDHVVGVVAPTHGEALVQQERLSAPAMRELLGDPQICVLDVRRPAERLAGSVAGSVHIPLAELPRRLAELPRDRPLVVYCAGGYRSMIASSLLRAAGVEDVRDLRGGWSSLAR